MYVTVPWLFLAIVGFALTAIMLIGVIAGELQKRYERKRLEKEHADKAIDEWYEREVRNAFAQRCPWETAIKPTLR